MKAVIITTFLLTTLPHPLTVCSPENSILNTLYIQSLAPEHEEVEGLVLALK